MQDVDIRGSWVTGIREFFCTSFTVIQPITTCSINVFGWENNGRVSILTGLGAQTTK